MNVNKQVKRLKRCLVPLLIILPCICLSGSCIKEQNTSSPEVTLTPEQYFQRGIDYSSAKQYEQAIDDLAKAIELDPDNSTYYYERSKLYPYIGEWDRSLDGCNRVIEMDPYQAGAYYLRGIDYIREEKYVLACNDLTRASEFGITAGELQNLEELVNLVIKPGDLILLEAEYSSLGGTGCRGQYIGYNNTLHIYVFVNPGESAINIDKICISPSIDGKSKFTSPSRYIRNPGVQHLVICISSKSRIQNDLTCEVNYKSENASSFKKSNEITGSNM